MMYALRPQPGDDKAAWEERASRTPSEQVRHFLNSHSPLNVRWFGARGDGVTNDRAAFLRAAAAAAEAGGSIDVPEGRYLVSGGPVAFGNNTFVRGAGRRATVVLFRNDASTDGFVWESPTQYGQGGGIIDMSLRAEANTLVRDALAVRSWQQFSARRVLIQGAGRYGVHATDGIDSSFYEVTVAVPQVSGFWVGDYRYAGGATSNYGAGGLTVDLAAGYVPAANEWAGRKITFLGGATRTVVSNTAASPSSITFSGVALTSQERSALAGTTANVEFGSVATSQRFFGCYAHQSLSGPGFDLGGITLECHGCVVSSTGSLVNAPAVRLRHGGVNWYGGHLEDNRDREFHLGTEGPACATITGAGIIGGNTKAFFSGASGVRGGPYLFSGGWFGGDVSQGGLANSLDLDLGGSGFSMMGVRVGTKAPTWNGGSTLGYRGFIQYLDPATGDLFVNGKLAFP